MTTAAVARRALNVAVAAAGLVILIPVLLVIALAVKLSSDGPVRFIQTRIGLDRRRRASAPDTGTRHRDLGGAPFPMLKFRTMYVQAVSAQQWATVGDPRVTPVGRVLRKFRLDELPQLFNVLRGEMNVVGPRPEQPLIFARLRDRIARYARRQRVQPGITGWAQVNGWRGETDTLDKMKGRVQHDLEYVQNWSLWLDLKILARTVQAVFARTNAV